MEKAGEMFKPTPTALAILQTAATGSDGIPQKVTSQPIPADVRCGPTFAHCRDQGIRPVLDQPTPLLRNNTDATLEMLLDLERQEFNREFSAVCGYHIQVKEEESQIHLALRNPEGRSWPEQMMYLLWMTNRFLAQALDN